jgi:L-rhamnose mutarotase
MKRYCFALDLKDDPALIEEYKRYHTLEHIWPTVLERVRGNGVLSEEIYLTGDRMFMILETTDDFSLEAKMAADSQSPEMHEWETLMWKFQKPLLHAKPGEKWVRMEKIFDVKFTTP